MAHTFCGEEGSGNFGVGLCSEFGIRTPIGYDEAMPGEQFPKLGIGLVRRLDGGPYSFARDADVEMFPFEVEEDSNSVRFDPLLCRGFAARFEKTLFIKENRLRVEYKLENTGGRPLRTEEYNHNFLCLNGRTTGEGYLLRSTLPLRESRVETEGERGTVEFQNALEADPERADAIRWKETPRHAFYAAMDLPEPQSERQSQVQATAWWELRHQETGIKARESTRGRELYALTLRALLHSARDLPRGLRQHRRGSRTNPELAPRVDLRRSMRQVKGIVPST